MSSTFSPAGGSPVQTCQRCHAPLSPHEVICSKCGYQNSAEQGSAVQPQNQASLLGNTAPPAPKKGLLQQYASQQTASIPGNVPTASPMQPQVSTDAFISPSSSSTNLTPYQSSNGSGTSLSMFKPQPGTGQYPPMQPSNGSGTSLSMFKPQPGTGQYPPVQPAPFSPPVVAPYQPQLSGGYPPIPGPAQPNLSPSGNLYGSIPSAPQSGPNTGAITGQFPGRPVSPLSRPMPSLPTSSMRMRTQSPPLLPRAPLEAQVDESPDWKRLTIILVVLLVLAGSGYLGFIKLMPQDKATQTNAPKIISYQPKSTPLFSDGFTNNIYGWNLQSDQTTFVTTIGAEKLTLECNSNKLLWELVPGNRMYTNFQVAFDATLSKGDQNNGYGVYIRGSSNGNSDLASYYRFELYGDGSYAVFKGTPDATGKTVDTKLVNYTGSSLINKRGTLNHVLIIANGSKLTFMVNGKTLKTFTDTSYTEGTIALFVSNLPEATPGAAAQFANFAIYPYPATK